MSTQTEVKLCEVCWKSNIAAQAKFYLLTIPVCDEHCHLVCGRCGCRWSARYALELDGNIILACNHCSEELKRLAARRKAYNAHLGSAEWRQTKKFARSQSRKEFGKVACSRCGMTERENRQEYGEGLHGHHSTYERFGCEKPDDVVLLCTRCHAWEHHLPQPKSINRPMKLPKGMVGR